MGKELPTECFELAEGALLTAPWSLCCLQNQLNCAAKQLILQIKTRAQATQKRSLGNAEAHIWQQRKKALLHGSEKR
ncbi:MAG: hypothetical protein II612_02125 [Prevotella sp.]|nr:hypothetical protein [Prevotella sp.]